MADPDSAIMPLGDHLEDLRRRLVLALVGLLPIFVLALVFGGPLLNFIAQPALDALRAADLPPRFQATSPLESFLAYLKVATIAAILVGGPWLLYQLWRFVAPGLYARERRFVYVLIPMSAALTALGMVFLYSVLLPISLTFLIGFGSGLVNMPSPRVEVPTGTVFPTMPALAGDPADGQLGGEGLPVGSVWRNTALGEIRVLVAPGQVHGARLHAGGAIAQQYRIGEYTSLVFTLGLIFAVAFQLPLAMMLLGWTGFVEARDLSRFRRQVAFGCAVAGAIFTPQDPWSMVLLALALYMLFEFGLVLMRFVKPSVIAGDGAPSLREHARKFVGLRGRTDGDQGEP